MILFTLRCARGHEFEGWFRDGDTFEAQRRTGEIACPDCGDRAIEKAMMAPRLGRSRDDSPPAPMLARLRAALSELRRQVEANCDYVGDRFAEEARRIHYGEVDARAIYGEASEKESRELVDEGISIRRIPWVAPTDS
jgi:hypothetical protein